MMICSSFTEMSAVIAYKDLDLSFYSSKLGY